MFSGEELHSWLEQRLARVLHRVKTLSDSELLAQPIDDLVGQLYADYDVELPRLLTGQQEAVETGAGAALELRVPLAGDPGSCVTARTCSPAPARPTVAWRAWH